MGEMVEKREEIMRQWDYWRAEIANGHKGSAPRDWFESVLDYYEEKLLKIREQEQKNSSGAGNKYPNEGQ